MTNPALRLAAHDGIDVTQSRQRKRVLIDMRGIGITFQGKTGNVVAVEKLDAAIHTHEFVSLVGPSGCGKSTILRLIAGLLPASTGTIGIDGETPAEARLARRFGFVF